MNRSVLSASIAALIALSVCACLAAGDDSAQPGKLAKPKAPLMFKVSGQAETLPESVIIHFAIVGDGDTLSAAEEQMQKTEQSVSSSLQKQGLKPKDMQLERFAAIPLQPTGIRSSTLKPLGYRVQREYKIILPAMGDSLDRALKIADAALSQGGRPLMLADQSYDTSDLRTPSLMEFTIKDSEKLIKEAMGDALKRARRLAEQAAGEMGCPPSAVSLASVQASQISVGPDSYDSGQGHVPLSYSSWQPIKAIVSVEAHFDVIRP